MQLVLKTLVIPIFYCLLKIMKKYLMLFTLILVAAIGVGFRFKPVTFNRDFLGVKTGYDNVFELCFDRTGSVYPEPQGEFLVTPRNQRMFEQLYVGKVEDYFQEGRISKNYSDIEPETLRTYAHTVRSAITDPDNTRLILLIHGFNADYNEARKNYEECQRLIDAHGDDRKNIYIRIYWDGLRSTLFGGQGGFIDQWLNACHQSVAVGAYGLRRFLNELYAEELIDIPIVIIGHDRGAAVIAAALWNYQSPKNRRPVQNVAFRFKYVSIGMIAPSISPLAMHPESFDPNWMMIVGFNPEDEFNRQFKNPPPGFFGSTQLGCVLSSCREVEIAFGEKMKRIDFAGDDHDFNNYLNAKDHIFVKEFLPLLLSTLHQD
jgi:pimeloyl-ACP methyl ester carboxylesterase